MILFEPVIQLMKFKIRVNDNIPGGFKLLDQPLINLISIHKLYNE